MQACSPWSAAHRGAWLSLLAAVLVLGGAAAPAHGKAKAKPIRCKPGQVPAMTGSGKALRVKVAKKGKARCVAAPKLVSGRAEPAAATPQGTVASTADGITQALSANPSALAKAEGRVGKKATRALVDRALQGWRPAAKAGVARRAEADTAFHFDGSFGDGTKGTSGSARIDAGPAGENGAGIKATATIEFKADAAGLKALGADGLTSGKSAAVKLEISFEDAPAQCPTAEGRVEGKIAASATLTLTIDGKVTTVSAKVDATYHLTVGNDARWKTIDGVDVWTTFTYAATGEKSSTWRGNRAGSGFTEKGIFGPGAGGFEGAIAEQDSHLRQDLGGVWGPRGRVIYSDPSTDNIFNYGGSLDHLRGMILTEVATRYLTYAAVEYVRQIVAPRGQRHWLDAEACLRLEGAPDKARLSAGETAKVTVKNARAASGAPARTDQTATGVASITPGSASTAPAGIAEYTLTAPSTSPVRATWQVVALSPAGKKTLTGTLTEAPGYTVVLDDRERGTFATHVASGHLQGTLSTIPVPEGPPGTSTATGPLSWSELSATSTVEHSWLENPIPSGTWTAKAESAPADRVKISLDFAGNARVNWTFVNDEPYDPSCQCDPPRVDVPGMTGLMTVALWDQPIVFEVPSTGGTFDYDRSFLSEGDGFSSKGTVTVIPGAS